MRAVENKKTLVWKLFYLDQGYGREKYSSNTMLFKQTVLLTIIVNCYLINYCHNNFHLIFILAAQNIRVLVQSF